MFELTGETPNGNAVYFYAGEFGYFMSNFSAFRVRYDGVDWMTSEYAYQANKFPKDGNIYHEIRTARSAHEALKIAHKYREYVRPEWGVEFKVQLMTEIVQHKFEQHEYIQRKLQKTGDAWLIENSETDAFWGRGPDWNGRNELGKIWTRLRKKEFGT